MRNLDRIGRYLVEIVEWSLRESRGGGAVGVAMVFKVLGDWYEDAWRDWREYEENRVEGSWWPIKKDGSVNQSAVDQLAESLGWAGDLSVFRGPPLKMVVQVDVKLEEYEGKTSYRAAWMYHKDASTSGLGGVTEERGQELETRFGSMLRAAASGAQKSAPGGGGSPEKAKEPAQTDAEKGKEIAKSDDDGLPF